MKHPILLGVLLVLALIATPHAQIPDFPSGCPTCRVFSYIDWATHDTIAGWGFECESGQPISRVDIWYQTPDGLFHPAPVMPFLLLNDTTGTPVRRPDVAAHYRTACTNVTPSAGFHYYPAERIPADVTVIGVTVWRGPLKNTSVIRLKN